MHFLNEQFCRINELNSLRLWKRMTAFNFNKCSRELFLIFLAFKLIPLLYITVGGGEGRYYISFKGSS